MSNENTGTLVDNPFTSHSVLQDATVSLDEYVKRANEQIQNESGLVRFTTMCTSQSDGADDEYFFEIDKSQSRTHLATHSSPSAHFSVFDAAASFMQREMSASSVRAPVRSSVISHQSPTSPKSPVNHMGSVKSLRGQKYRGLNVEFMSSKLLEEVRAAGLDTSATIYDIEAPVILAKGEKVICPRDAQVGAAYVDCVSCSEGSQSSTHMLSYTWGYTIGDVVSGMQEFCKDADQDPAETYFWCCCLCINQHRVRQARLSGETIPFERFQAEFGERVAGIAHIVALMSPWHDPFYTKRVWCDFEMFTATEHGDRCQISVTMPSREAADMRETLLSEEGSLSVSHIWNALQNVEIEKAEASVPEDKTGIFRLIENGVGFSALNRTVVKCLQKWIVGSCETYLNEHSIASKADSEHVAKLCAEVGDLLTKVGLYDRANTVLNRGRQIRADAMSLDTEAGVRLMMNLGVVRGIAGDPENALEALKTAREMLEPTRTRETNPGLAADVLYNLGIAMGKRGDIDAELEAYEEARCIHEKQGTLETPAGADLLRYLAIALGTAGHTEGERDNLELARLIREHTGTLSTPEGAALMRSLGLAKGKLGDQQGEIKAFEEAKHIREHTGTLETRGGAALLADLGCSILMEARRIHEAIGTLDTPEGKTLVHELSRTIERKEGLATQDSHRRKTANAGKTLDFANATRQMMSVHRCVTAKASKTSQDERAS